MEMAVEIGAAERPNRNNLIGFAHRARRPDGLDEWRRHAGSANCDRFCPKRDRAPCFMAVTRAMIGNIGQKQIWLTYVSNRERKKKSDYDVRPDQVSKI